MEKEEVKKKVTYKEKYNELKEKYAALEKENSDNLNKYMLSVADFQNYRRNKESEMERIRKVASKNVILYMMELYDDFKRSIEYNPDNNDVNLLFKELNDKLSIFGVETYGVSGEDFNSDIHEAISVVNESENKGKIKTVYKCGCKLNGEIIRHAQVIVCD